MPARDCQREFALEVARKLRRAGFESLWAGGCVRDQLLGMRPKDYDVATNATPEQVREVFGRRRTLPIGASFGVITVLGPREVGQIDVATFRTDASYSDGRHPDSVAFTTAEHDAERRDFTINGLFYDPIAEQVIDYVGGQQDLSAHIIRAIGDPRLRIGEDHLRMLRAVRFAATYSFSIEPSTFAAIQEMAPRITTVSAERIGSELRRMLLDSNRTLALTLLRDTKLLHQVLPEVAALSVADFQETIHTLTSLQSPSMSLALAATLYQVLPPSPPGSDSAAVAPRASLLVPPLCRRLRYTNKELERTTWLLTHLETISNAEHLSWPTLQRLLTHDGAIELLALREAIAGTDDSALVFCRERLAWPVERLNPRPLVDGSALIEHGLKPGPHFSEILEQIRDAQLNGVINSPAEALALADRLRRTE